MSKPLTESSPTSGSGQSNCGTCAWQVISETATTVTSRCTRCGQSKTVKKANLTEAQGEKKLLLEG